jgi:hypothetical protein
MMSPEPPKRRPLNGRRWFVAALALFLAWVAVLGALAFLSGRRPASRPPTAQATP